MPETSAIADMANRVAKEVFAVFGWRQTGLLDQNWDCSTDEHHKRTHPTDVVFYYDDPYTRHRLYVNTDLKSYGGASIERGRLGGALKSLAMTVECANSGPHWRAKYDDGSSNSRVTGLLFVYNHDETFKDDNGEFHDKLNTLARESLEGAYGHHLFVMGPSTITFLYTVASDIKMLRGERRLPLDDTGKCTFWYPDLVQAKIREQEFPAATLEMLTGPWIIMRADTHHYVLWYREHGNSADEFRYLLEYLFYYQLLNHESASVDVRLVKSHPDALSHFATAKEKFDRAHHRLASERLKRINCEPVSRVRSNFSTTPLKW